jgi:hypothetical protein
MTRQRHLAYITRFRTQLRNSTLERDINYLNATSAAMWCRRNNSASRPWFKQRFGQIRKETR